MVPECLGRSRLTDCHTYLHSQGKCRVWEKEDPARDNRRREEVRVPRKRNPVCTWRKKKGKSHNTAVHREKKISVMKQIKKRLPFAKRWVTSGGDRVCAIQGERPAASESEKGEEGHFG